MKDGGSAFPNINILPENQGLTVRDYFAGQALAGMCADWLNMPDESELPPDVSRVELVTDFCYQIADAMIAAREKKQHKEEIV